MSEFKWDIRCIKSEEVIISIHFFRQNIQIALEGFEKNSNPIIWDARDLSVQVPEWAINPNDNVMNLRNYFVASDGRDLIEIMITALTDAKNTKSRLLVQSSDLKDTLLF